MARKLWLESKRISINDLANAVGVSRVTLYRWVGSKDRLIEEVLWSFAKPTFENAIRDTPGNGVEHIVEVHRRFMTALGTFEPMRRFVYENPTAAIRIQINDPNSAHGRIIAASANHLRQQVSGGHLEVSLPVARLAEMITFTNGALLYSALVGGRDPLPAIDQACIISELLLKGELSEKIKTGRSTKSKHHP
ncbi:MAG: QsdR family transcriptional regulator [Desulfobacteraceae bacterium]|nr:QsdR family transcriptional regulator [Desulfobacteraceae bacterium]